MAGIEAAAGGALLTAFLITLLEMTDVVALVYALGAGASSMRPGFTGACLGVAAVAISASIVGLFLINYGPDALTHAIGTVMLWSFAVVLLRSTLKTYVKEARKRAGRKEPAKSYPSPDSLTPRELFAIGLTVGIGESMEAVVPLLALVTPPEHWLPEVIGGAVLGGVAIVLAGFFLHEHVKKVKVPVLKWVTTSLLFSFAVLWTWEALGELHLVAYAAYFWGVVPNDILLVPLFCGFLVVVRGIALLAVRKDAATWSPRPSRPRSG